MKHQLLNLVKAVCDTEPIPYENFNEERTERDIDLSCTLGDHKVTVSVLMETRENRNMFQRMFGLGIDYRIVIEIDGEEHFIGNKYAKPIYKAVAAYADAKTLDFINDAIVGGQIDANGGELLGSLGINDNYFGSLPDDFLEENEENTKENTFSAND